MTEELKAIIVATTPGRLVADQVAYIKEHYNIELTIRQVQRYRHKLGVRSGAKKCFEKGDKHPNKGKHLSKEHRDKISATKKSMRKRCSFAASLGTRHFMGNYWCVKTESGWKLEHKLLWEKHNGPIPDGHVLTFIDGDVNNIVLDNLELLTKHEIALRNRCYSFIKGNKEYNKLILTAVKLKKVIMDINKGESNND